MTDFNGYINKYGLVVMQDGDAGDAPMKTGFYFVAQYLLSGDAEHQAALRQSLDKTLSHIQLPAGEYIRDPEHWNDPKDFSRDQTWPILAACHILGLVGRCDQIINAMLKRLSRAQNGDLVGPDIWAAMIRFKRLWALWPLLLIFDLAIVINSLAEIIKGGDPDNVGDDNNHCLMLLVSRLYWPTPISWLARKLYSNFRPPNYGCLWREGVIDATVISAFKERVKNGGLIIYRHPVVGAWAWYWRPSTGAPPMAELWQPILEKYILR